MCVQRFDDSLEFCNSHYLSHFAAFFIDARTKRSVVESFALIFVYTQVKLHDSKEFKGLSTDADQRIGDDPPAVGEDGSAEATLVG